MIDMTRLGSESADDRFVAFSDALAFKEILCPNHRVFVRGEEQRSGSGLVQAVDRKHPLSNLVSQELHGETRFLGIDLAAMHEQSRRFVDRDVLIVAVQNGEKLFGRVLQGGRVL